MRLRGYLAALVGALLASACASVPQEPRLDHHLRAAIINDPGFGGIEAFTVNIPSTWHFQGVVIADVGCNPPSPVFRAYSPDGLSEIRLLPSFNWIIRAKGAARPERLNPGRLCIDLNGPMTATQFLDRYLRTLDSPRVLGPMNIAAGYREQLDRLLSRMNALPPIGAEARSRTTGDAAAVRIETTNGTFTIRERLRARVVCTFWAKTIGGQRGFCAARLDVLRAPAGEFDSLVNLVDRHNLTTAKSDQAWLHQWIGQFRRRRKYVSGDRYRTNPDAVAMLYRQAGDFGLVHRLPCQRFLACFDGEYPGAERVLTSFLLANYLRTRDWADFALDSRSTRGPDGKPYVATTLSTWRSSDGRRYKTGYRDANPNGVFPGRWTVRIVSLPIVSLPEGPPQ